MAFISNIAIEVLLDYTAIFKTLCPESVSLSSGKSLYINISTISVCYFATAKCNRFTPSELVHMTSPPNCERTCITFPCPYKHASQIALTPELGSFIFMSKVVLFVRRI